MEFGEFANATRCFKYWSNKPSEAQDIVLDEYVDGLHFFLSLGIDIKASKKVYHYTKHSDDPTNYYESYGIPLMESGTYEEIFNSDKDVYGGDNQYNGLPVDSEPGSFEGLPAHMNIKLASLVLTTLNDTVTNCLNFIKIFNNTFFNKRFDH